MTLLQFIMQGGAVLLVLCVCSVFSFAVILDRLYIILTTRRQAKKLTAAIMMKIKKQKIDDAISLCEKETTLIHQLFGTILIRRGQPKADIEEAAQRNGMKLSLFLEERLGVLATMGSITPFIGLFGTVIGIIKTFLGISFTQSYAASMVTSGIAEALLNTAAGLLVAVPAVMTYNYFLHTVQKMMKELEITCSEMIENVKA